MNECSTCIHESFATIASTYFLLFSSIFVVRWRQGARKAEPHARTQHNTQQDILQKHGS